MYAFLQAVINIYAYIHTYAHQWYHCSQSSACTCEYTHTHPHTCGSVCVHVCLSVCTMHACSGRFVFNYIYQCLASRLRSPPNPVQSCSSNLLVSRFRNQDFQDLGSWAEFFLLKGNPKCPMDRLNSDMRRGVWFWSSGVHLSLPPLAWKLCLPGS